MRGVEPWRQRRGWWVRAQRSELTALLAERHRGACLRAPMLWAAVTSCWTDNSQIGVAGCSIVLYSFYQYYVIVSFFFKKRKILGMGRARTFVHMWLIELKFRLMGTFSRPLASEVQSPVPWASSPCRGGGLRWGRACSPVCFSDQ